MEYLMKTFGILLVACLSTAALSEAKAQSAGQSGILVCRNFARQLEIIGTFNTSDPSTLQNVSYFAVGGDDQVAAAQVKHTAMSDKAGFKIMASDGRTLIGTLPIVPQQLNFNGRTQRHIQTEFSLLESIGTVRETVEITCSIVSTQD
jgi:hypothetical protein